jgi:hypothetical protein
MYGHVNVSKAPTWAVLGIPWRALEKQPSEPNTANIWQNIAIWQEQLPRSRGLRWITHCDLICLMKPSTAEGFKKCGFLATFDKAAT